MSKTSLLAGARFKTHQWLLHERILNLIRNFPKTSSLAPQNSYIVQAKLTKMENGYGYEHDGYDHAGRWRTSAATDWPAIWS